MSNYKHGHAYKGKITSEFITWQNMRRRCKDPNNKAFKYYGGRGIKVCDEWEEFENFLGDMGFKPTKNHSIERVNVYGDYEPTNCEWILKEDNARNKTCNVYVEYHGETKCLRNWCSILGLNYKTIHTRYRKHKRIDPEFLFRPVRKMKCRKLNATLSPAGMMDS